MKTLILATIAAILTTSAGAQATEVPFISIQAEAHAGETYTMGFDYDSSGTRLGIFYADPNQDDPTLRDRHFSLASIKATPVVLLHQKKYDVIKLGYDNDTGTVTIFYQRDVRNNIWSKKVLTVQCDANNNCSVVDPDTGKPSHLLYIWNHRQTIGITVGVESIESR